MTTVSPNSPGALSGIRVLDFTFIMSGPYCTRLMADLGAEVIKIEPKSGDLLRGRPPFRQGKSSYFAQLNCGKKSIVLDLKNPAGRRIAYDLIKKADVMVENFRVGVMKRLGLDFDTVRDINPRIVYCSISGFGQGDDSDGKGAYAPTLHAMSGFDNALLSQLDEGQRPPGTGIFIGDILGGALAFGGIQAALVQRARTGAGDHVDVSLLDGMLNLLVCEIQESQFPDQPGHVVYRPTRARDGFLVIAPVTQENFIALCAACGHPEWLEDSRFPTGETRQANWAQLQAVMDEWAAQYTVRECERILESHQVPCSRYLDISEAMRLPAVKARGTISEVDDGEGPFLISGPPFRLHEGNAALRQHFSDLGGDGPAILAQWLQLSKADIDRLEQDGAFGR